MHLDVIDLKKFYYRTKLGVVVKDVLSQELTDIWRDAVDAVLARHYKSAVAAE